MEKTLKRLCAEHGLTSISAMLFTEVKVKPITVYVHWKDRECVGERRRPETITEAA